MDGISWEGGLIDFWYSSMRKPPSQLIPFIDQINVDLTPIKFIVTVYIYSFGVNINACPKLSPLTTSAP